MPPEVVLFTARQSLSTLRVVFALSCPKSLISRPPNHLNDSHRASSWLLHIDDFEPRVRLPKNILKALCCPFTAVELSQHGDVGVPVKKKGFATSVNHFKYRKVEISWMSNESTRITHRGCFSVHLVSGPSFNNHSNSTTLEPSFIAGTRAFTMRTAYLSLQSCKIHLKK